MSTRKGAGPHNRPQFTEEELLRRQIAIVQSFKGLLQNEASVAAQTVAAFSDLLDDCILDVAQEVHREARTGTLPAPYAGAAVGPAGSPSPGPSTGPPSTAAHPPPLPTKPGTKGPVDVFGQSHPPKATDIVSCRNCGRQLRQDTQPPEPQGILLYYKYVPLHGNDAEDVQRFYTELCGRLDLRGRIRVARDGVNVTVGGSMAALQAHITAVSEHPVLQGADIDFKLASSGGPRNEATRAETKMDRLVVRLCEELVTLGPLARHRADPRVSTAPHLTPDQFHKMLQRATTTTSSATSTAMRTVAEATAPAAAAEQRTAEAVAVAVAARPSPDRPSDSECELADVAGGCGTAAAVFRDSTAGGEDEQAKGGFAAVAAATAVDNTAASGGGGGGGDVAIENGGDGGGGGSAGGAGCGGVSGGGFGPNDGSGPLVLLDARNIYETRIGHFDAVCTTLLGFVQRVVDLPAWLDAHEDLLRNRTVLMYCTGGVRCERASAYLREKGPEFSRVFQLSGGIQRYLERFPDGGFFRGKNFFRCRLLVLVCDECTAAHSDQDHPRRHRQQQQQKDRRSASPPPSPQPQPAPPASRDGMTRGSVHPLLCELCTTATATAAGGGGSGSGLMDAQVAAVDGMQGGGSVGDIRGPAGTAVAAADSAAPSPSVPVEPAAAAAVSADGSISPFAPSSPGGETRALGSAAAAAATATGATAIAATAATTAAMADAAGGVGTAAPAASPAAAAAAGGGCCGGSSSSSSGSGSGPRRLRILCLHGFRQTGKQFQGRTCALRKKLRDLADFVFVDAPHTLPFFVKPGANVVAGGGGGGVDDANSTYHGGPDELLLDTGCGIKGNGSSSCGNVEALMRDDDGELEEEVAVNGRAVQLSQAFTRSSEGAVGAAPPPPPPPPPAAKRAWLLPPEQYGGGAATGNGDGWQEAPAYVDELQYTRQTEGWEESLAAVQAAVRHLGPFDGVFGFSQGASVAAVLCALQQLQQRRRQKRPCQEHNHPERPSPQQQHHNHHHHHHGNVTDAGAGPDGCDFGFRFAILASGFPSPLPLHRELMAAAGPLELPSLHVYGSAGASGACGGADRQISPRESESLSAMFSCAGGRRRCLCHQSGHLIPATKGHAATFRTFLAAQLLSVSPAPAPAPAPALPP
ncbi:hypothetical protein VOLCADRAFT_120801 [Volvox carteri f. nagariensis]|uniref:Rhodanese domain-containing protein n=1 Tax=Volvox carteri f. nagariensis TaxID=3068 RepID=D8TTM4_VOLCA|nr:uncharacterized protein VOLCADRAFT_120801 [Volvox carteri f. nagariensis]EFJ49333.1 hypothetical protein VOLCADRAFT_120801 [Volvox carteri f. nagariensis]|eukprot:XP_002949781.1 hypothetical protein VOLCADRAFT_120801 [Volvox carteri f. nagariensis]